MCGRALCKRCSPQPSVQAKSIKQCLWWEDWSLGETWPRPGQCQWLWTRRPWMVCAVCLSVSGATLRNLRVINSYLLLKELLLGCYRVYLPWKSVKQEFCSRFYQEKNRCRPWLCPVTEDGFTPHSPRCLFSRSVMMNISIRRCGRKHVSHPSPRFNPAVITVRTHKSDLSGVHNVGHLALWHQTSPQTHGGFGPSSEHRLS